MGLKVVDDPDLVAALDALSAQDNAGSKAGHYASITGRGVTEGAVSGVAGLPALVADSFRGVGRDILYAGHKLASKAGIANAPDDASYYGGSNFPASEMVDQAGKGLADAAGFDEAQTPGERIYTNGVAGLTGALSGAGAGKVLGSVARAGSVAQKVGGALAAAPATQAVGGAAGGALSQAVSEGGGSQAQQVGAGLIGGAVGGLGVMAGQRALRTAGGALAPMTAAGRDDIIGNMLNERASNPQAAAQRMQGGGPQFVPGVEHTVGAVAEDPGLAAFESGVRNSGADVQGRFAQRASTNNEARNVYLDAAQGDDPTMLTQQRQVTTDPMREQALAGNPQASLGPVWSRLDPLINSADYQRPAIKQAVDFVANRIGIGGGQQLDVRSLYALRKDINDAIAGKTTSELQGMRYAAKELQNIRRGVDEAINSATGGQFGKYINEYRSQSQDINNAQTMRDVRTSSGFAQPDVTTGYDMLSPAKMKTAILSRADKFNNLQPFQKEALNRVLADLQQANYPNTPGVRSSGSDTMRNLSVAAALGRIVSPGAMDNSTLRALAKPLTWLYSISGSNDKLAERLVDIMLDPHSASVLMQKATPRNMQTLSQQLMVGMGKTGVSAIRGAQNTEPYMGGDYVLNPPR